jgi:hypothetical protein
MMSIPAPGYPIAAAGARIYQSIFNQPAPTQRSAEWWYNWFSQLGSVSQWREWSTAQRSRNATDMLLAAADRLRTWGSRLAAAERKNPGIQTKAEDIPFNPLVTTSQGWSLWRGGAFDTPLSENQWYRIALTHFTWAAKEVEKGVLSTRVIDIIIQHMFLAVPTERRLPVFSAPADVLRNPIATEGWYLWKRTTGGNEAMALFNRDSMQRWEQQNEQFSRLQQTLGNAETVLRYVSMQEPVLRLLERLEEFDVKRQSLANGYRVYVQNRELARGIFTPAEVAQIEQDMQEFRREENDLITTLPAGLYDGKPSPGLSDLGLGIVGAVVIGTVAAGFLAAVAYTIAKIDNLIARQRGLSVQQRLSASVQEQIDQVERNRQESILAAERVQDADRRAQLINEANATASRSLALLARTQADISQATRDIALNDGQGKKKEQTWLAVGAGLAILGYMAWNK